MNAISDCKKRDMNIREGEIRRERRSQEVEREKSRKALEAKDSELRYISPIFSAVSPYYFLPHISYHLLHSFVFERFSIFRETIWRSSVAGAGGGI